MTTDILTPRQPLRVGVLIDSFDQPAWVAAVIDDIMSSDVATVALVVRNASPTMVPPPRSSLATRMRRWAANRRSLLFALYERLDQRKFGTPDDPLRLVDVSTALASVPLIDVLPRETRFSDYFSDLDVERILAHDLDVALRLGFRILRGRALQIASSGVWSYHHGDNLVNRGGPAGFWEVMRDEPVTGSVLQILSEDLDAGRVIYRSQASTARLSVAKNRAGYFWKSSAFVIRKLRELHEIGDDALRDPDGTLAGPRPYSRPLYVTPDNRELAPHLWRLVRRYTREKVHELTEFDQWTLAYRLAPHANCGNVPDMAPFRFRPLVPPVDRFWADPFPLRVGDRYFVLFEELEYRAPKGRICGVEIGKQGPVGEPVRVLERDYHLSYPYTFEWRGELFMIPETAANRTVELYRAVRPPYEWAFDRVLLSDVSLVDATVVEIDGRWWMFTGSIARGGSRCDELNLFFADSPLGPWHPHRRNPVVSDVRHARPAGRLFEIDGHWYRPAQDCSRRYGYAIALRRIVRLDPERFEEVTVGALRPEWAPSVVATHTVNAVDGLTIIDAQVRRRRPWFGARGATRAE